MPHCLLTSGLANQVQSPTWCPLGDGQKSTEDSSWHQCLLISQRSPAAIIFHGAQERLAGGGATHCPETEIFKETERGKGREVDGEVAFMSFLVTCMSEKSAHTFPGCGGGTFKWKNRTKPYLNLLRRSSADCVVWKGLLGRKKMGLCLASEEWISGQWGSKIR